MPAPEIVSTLTAEVRRFARANIDAAALEAKGELPTVLLDRLAELGLFALTIPERYDGAALGLEAGCEVIEELARHDRSVATTVGLHAGLGSQAIVRGATESVAATWLPRLARGECIGAFAATEAGAGSDLMSIRTTLDDVDDDCVCLDGEKSYVTNAHYAGCFTVLAKRGAHGHSLVLVPRATPGVSIGAEETKLGLRASSTATVRFDGVRLPRSYVLGVDGSGIELAYGVLRWGRTMMAAGCVGTAQAALDMSLEHVTHRKQFRRPLAAFPAVQAQLARTAAMLDAARALVRRTARALDDEQAGEAISLATKVFASEESFSACDVAIQLHGALGVIEPIGVARLLRDCRVTRIFEGANDVLLVRLATARLATSERRERIADDATPLAEEARRVNALAASLDAALDAVRDRLGFAAITRQILLTAIARADVAHQAAIALVLSPPRDRARLHFALRLLERAFTEALSDIEFAEGSAKLAKQICDRLQRPEEIAPNARDASLETS